MIERHLVDGELQRLTQPHVPQHAALVDVDELDEEPRQVVDVVVRGGTQHGQVVSLEILGRIDAGVGRLQVLGQGIGLVGDGDELDLRRTWMPWSRGKGIVIGVLYQHDALVGRERLDHVGAGVDVAGAVVRIVGEF